MKSLRQEAKVSHDAKVGRMLKGFADGGAVDKEDQDDEKPVAFSKKASGGLVTGKPAKARLDRPAFARGGRAKHHSGKTNVTVVVGGDKQPQPPMNLPPPMLPPRPPMAPPPGPPMPPPGAMGAGPPGAGPPGGMPPAGLPVRKHGGAVKSIGMKVGTKVSHTPGKNDLGKISSAPPRLTRADGGRVHKYLQPDDGAGSGEGRKEKAASMKRVYP